MNIEPQELRIHRTSRSEAVRRAARLLGEQGEAKPVDAIQGLDGSQRVDPAVEGDALPHDPSQIDEAFASLAADPAALRPDPADLAQTIATQLRQLDDQRERLAGLLAGLDNPRP